MDKDEIIKVFAQYHQIPPPVKIYDDLTKLEPCIFLYRGHRMGHWCAILGHPDSWEIFDPIGMWPDTELNHPQIRKIPPRMAALCNAQPFRVDYNDCYLQTGGSSCGLWCIFRFLHHKLSYLEFVSKFGKWTDRDICRFFKRYDLLQ